MSIATRAVDYAVAFYHNVTGLEHGSETGDAWEALMESIRADREAAYQEGFQAGVHRGRNDQRECEFDRLMASGDEGRV